MLLFAYRYPMTVYIAECQPFAMSLVNQDDEQPSCDAGLMRDTLDQPSAGQRLQPSLSQADPDHGQHILIRPRRTGRQCGIGMTA
jgi:hypothetical protein